jgi:hypothetical protein
VVRIAEWGGTVRAPRPGSHARDRCGWKFVAGIELLVAGLLVVWSFGLQLCGGILATSRKYPNLTPTFESLLRYEIRTSGEEE